MSFINILKELTHVSGATGAVMLDWEGEIVADYSTSEGLELDLIGAHHGIILDIIKEAAACHYDGHKAHSNGLRVSSVIISTGGLRLIISTLKDNYYLVVTMPRSKGLASRAAYNSGKAVMKLEKEMG